MKRVFYFVAVLCFVLLAATGCKPQDENIGTEAQLYGRWQDVKNTTSFIVFQTDHVAPDDERFYDYTDYIWGKEWDTNDKTEHDLDTEDFHGNGWFLWKKGPKIVSRLATMNKVSTALTPADMNLTILNDSTLKYTTDSGREFTFRKIASK